MKLKNIFDSHAHYDDERFGSETERDELIKSLFFDSVSTIINVGSDLKTSENSIKLSKKFDNIYSTVGVHPHEVENLPSDYLDKLKQMSKFKKCVAIGEIGLDYFYENSPKIIQQKIFEEQLILAKNLNLPVVIHSRNACDDTLNIIDKYKPKGVFHCFSYSREIAEKIINNGMYIGITGVVTFKNAKKVIETVSSVPIEKLLLETDCPYMAPEPFRGNRCDSSMISSTASKIAEIKGIAVQDLIDITAENALNCFMNLKL